MEKDYFQIGESKISWEEKNKYHSVAHIMFVIDTDNKLSSV